MIDLEVVKKLKARYNHIHPLIFHRSLERAKSPGDLYDILETLPNKLTIIWNPIGRRWTEAEDITMSKEADFQDDSEQ